MVQPEAVPLLRIRDDLGRDLLFGDAPRRIVSLVPSDTFSVVALGAADRLVGRTTYCEHALEVATVGGTKDVDVDAVLALSPDLVIANQEENTRGPLERLASQVKVLVSLPRRAADGVAHLARLARILRVERDPSVVELIRRGYAAVKVTRPGPPLPVFVPIWAEPLMTFNGDTFGHDVLALAGAHNVFGDRLRLYPLAADLGKAAPIDAGARDVRYPRIRKEEIAERGAKAVLLPDEPYVFSDEEIAAITELPSHRVSGKDLFWYGAWTVEAIERVASIVRSIEGQ
jgi:ABC-type Fe3+-hydroxamate transport system substrate-binding protein